jgi:hypothetical protein
VGEIGVYGCDPDDVFKGAELFELEPREDKGPNELREVEDVEPAPEAGV